MFVCDPHCISCSDGLVWISTSVVGVCLKAGHIFQSNAGAGTACARARVCCSILAVKCSCTSCDHHHALAGQAHMHIVHAHVP